MFLFVSAVHFDENIFSAHSLQMVRGASMILENIASALEKELSMYSPKVVSQGSSIALLEFSDDKQDEMESALVEFLDSEPYGYFSFIWGFGETREKAQKASALKTYKVWTVPVKGLGLKTGPDPIEKTGLIRPTLVSNIRAKAASRLAHMYIIVCKRVAKFAPI